MKNRILQVLKNPYILLRGLITKRMFHWVPDHIVLKINYRARMDKKLNLKNPNTFNEKLQWLKLNDRKSEYTQLADKYEVRNYIKETIGEKYLIPSYGVWDTFDDIDFDKLPNQFVLKTTHDSGGVVICRDKHTFDKNEAKKKINKSLNKNYYYGQREWPYKNIKPRILAEKFMYEKENESLKDYKIMCFNGVPKVIQIMSERTKNGFYISHYDTQWNEMEIKRKTIKKSSQKIKKPKKLNEMLNISRALSKSIPFVRVDLYYIKGNIYFGELTFYPVSGHMDFVNEKDDRLLGSWINLPSSRK